MFFYTPKYELKDWEIAIVKKLFKLPQDTPEIEVYKYALGLCACIADENFGAVLDSYSNSHDFYENKKRENQN